MSDSSLVEVLESLNVTLGAVKDALRESGSDDAVEEQLGKLETAVATYRGVIEDDGKVGKLIRINRELKEQLALIRDIASPQEDDLRLVTDPDD